jgi:hypothetical protein
MPAVGFMIALLLSFGDISSQIDQSKGPESAYPIRTRLDPDRLERSLWFSTQGKDPGLWVGYSNNLSKISRESHPRSN